MTDPEIRSVAFLGLGNMGLPMATNLRKAGYVVHGYDPATATQHTARAAGLKMASSAKEALEGADAIITMLPSGRHVLDAYRGETGIIVAAPKNAIVVDCSTIDISDAKAAHAIASGAGLRSLDAPVSGGVVGATAGTLTFMIGGDSDTVGAASTLLGAMGKRIVHCGEAGAGQCAKVCNNMILASSMVAVAEAFVLAEALGLSDQALFDVVSTSSGQCWAVTANCPVPGPVPSSPANRDFEGGFATTLMVKDLRLAVSAASLGAVDIAIARNALAIYEEVMASQPNRDFSIVINAIRNRAEELTGKAHD